MLKLDINMRKEMTFRVVDQWIDHYGEKLYEFIAKILNIALLN